MDEDTWVQVQALSLAVRHWKSHLTPLNLSFLICEVGTIRINLPPPPEIQKEQNSSPEVGIVAEAVGRRMQPPSWQEKL